MFLLLYGRHVWHGVSIQSSISLGDTLLQITREWKTTEIWFLTRLFIYQSSIVSQILDLINWMVTIFSFDHMTGENREYVSLFKELFSQSYFQRIHFCFVRQRRNHNRRFAQNDHKVWDLTCLTIMLWLMANCALGLLTRSNYAYYMQATNFVFILDFPARVCHPTWQIFYHVIVLCKGRIR